MLVFLIGMMGSGKTSVGNLLAKKLQVPLIDIDKEIEKNENQLVKEIFDQKGEKYFLKIELNLIFIQILKILICLKITFLKKVVYITIQLIFLLR